MGFGDILGQMMQGGLGGPAQTGQRVNQSAQNLGAGGGAMEGIFAQLQGALGGSGGAIGGFAEKSKDFLGKEQVGGLTGGQIGGIGAIAGALLGGGAGGAVRGGAMAVLGTLALSALKNAQARAAAGQASPQALEPMQAAPAEVAALTGPAAEKLMIAAMVSAAKADGQIDKAEMEKIVGKIGTDSVTDEEKQFVMAQMQAPVDIAALAAQVTSPAQAAAVYAASLMTINVDSDQETAYLDALAKALGLDDATVMLLHQTTGVPA